VIDPLLLSAVCIHTFAGQTSLTNASGFFFERDERLFLVTSRHVLRDEPSGHTPDRIEIELHIDENNVAASTGFSIPLFSGLDRQWKEGSDHGGAVDVAVIEIDRKALPPHASYRAFSSAHLPLAEENVELGSALLVVGFPLGFHDTLHHLPVARQAIVASSFGLRFGGEGYFLTDARTHRGTSGAPVVMRKGSRANAPPDMPWLLLGIHSARVDVGTRDQHLDEALGLNCVWYADVLMSLTS
jgi:S1-C subfamily serine protease